jgi:hypothetical protein
MKQASSKLFLCPLLQQTKNKTKTYNTIVVEVQERKMTKKRLAKLAHKRTTQSLKTKT